MFKGTVKWFDPKKGFGFVIGPDGQEVFVHYSRIEGQGFRCLRSGQEVEYRPVQSDSGLVAEVVRPAACAAQDQPPVERRKRRDEPRSI